MPFLLVALALLVAEVAMPKRLVLSLDGTWNNPYQEKEREDGEKVFKPSNPLKVARAVRTVGEDGTLQLTYYDPGVGGLNQHPGTSNRMLRWVDNKLGGAWGAGFEGNIEDAYRFLVHNHVAGDEVFLFGFSRGAAEARGLARFVDWMGGVPAKDDAYYVPRYFAEYVASRGERASAAVTEAINRSRAQRARPLPPIGSVVPVRIRFLGVWDTVMALGSRIRASKGTSVRRRAFHVGPSPPPVVSVARQALAIDEKRWDFRPEIWSATAAEGQDLEQRWFAGVHSNVGGGYVEDGLANLALHWIADAAAEQGLDLDRRFLGVYRGYAMDRLVNSRSLLYKLRELPRMRSGVRRLEGHPESAHLDLHESVFWRLEADPQERKANGELAHPRMGERYRPENLLAFLENRGDLAEHLPGRSST